MKNQLPISMKNYLLGVYQRDGMRLMLFLLFGGVQFCLDAGLFMLMSYLGLSAIIANVLARFLAACTGFLLNGKMTFGREKLDRVQFARYVICWVALTCVSTLLIAMVASTAGLRWAWAAKILVEVVLAFVSFLMMRNWVFAKARAKGN